MTKTKTIKEEGMELAINDVVLEEKMPVIEISHTQAKKLAKKPMTEKQKAHVEKMVAKNREIWSQKKQEKEERIQRQQEEDMKTKTKVIVKPKRIYNRKPKEKYEVDEDYEPSESDSESDTDTESESEEEERPKKKKRTKVIKNKQLEEKLEKLKKIYTTLRTVAQPRNPLLDKIMKSWGR